MKRRKADKSKLVLVSEQAVSLLGGGVSAPDAVTEVLDRVKSNKKKRMFCGSFSTAGVIDRCCFLFVY